MNNSTLYIGLMSGTSLDGVDAVLADFRAGDQAPPELIAHTHHDFAAELRAELLKLNSPGWDDLDRAAIASQHLVRGYASAIKDLLLHAEIDAAQVRAIGAHGQTVRHRPEAGYTLQLNAPAMLAELTSIDVVADFRSRDIAAGGQGAPLVPAFHQALFTAAATRVIVNIGGISNITVLPPKVGNTEVKGTERPVGNTTSDVIGFDCGPGNALLDLWAQEHLGEPIDRNGRWAAGGQVNPALLTQLLSEPYFGLPFPKSTGRDLFNKTWLMSLLGNQPFSSQEVQTTLTQLTATTISEAITATLESRGQDCNEIIVCGGGAYNQTLMQMLTTACAPRRVQSSLAFNVAPEHVEPLAFAWLARAAVMRTPGNLPSVTGAKGARILGAIYPT